MPDIYQHIRFRVEGRVARVTFARPPLNIFTIAMMREVDAALTECMGMRDVVAVVFDAVEGSRAFSAGVSVEEHQPETVYQMLESFHDVFRTLDQMSKPALALVDGAALGGGCELVAGCDIVVAAARARFGQPEIKLGVFPPVAAVLLPRIMGERRARELLLTGEIFDAQEALRTGLVSYVVEAEQLEPKLQEILSRLRSVMKERTAIIISHRISTVRDADQIVVLDAGRVVEKGKHDELIRLGGVYAELYKKQLLEEELAAS